MTAGHTEGPPTCSKCYSATRNIVVLCRTHAAASAMLEALQTIQQTADRFKIYEIARSAVAKAQGRDSRKEGGK